MRVRPTPEALRISVIGDDWRLGEVVTPAGRSVLPGRSRPAQGPRQRRPLHALVRGHFGGRYFIQMQMYLQLGRHSLFL